MNRETHRPEGPQHDTVRRGGAVLGRGISERLHAADLPEVDVVVGIARGGLVPASLVAHQLRVPLSVTRVNYRDDNRLRADEPRLLPPTSTSAASGSCWWTT